MNGLRRALGFLTVYPLRASDTWTPEALGHSMAYYPIAGLLIGLSLWVLYLLLSALFVPAVVAALLLGGCTLVTGGLHVEGLAKTVNGLNGSSHREETLTIFKESHVSPTAAVSVMLLFLLKYACLRTIPFDAMLLTLILMTTLSRYSMAQLACFSPYASVTGGLGEPFVRGVRQDHFRTALLFTLLIVLVCGQTPGMLIGLLVSLATVGYQHYFRKRLGGITGDVLSATNEVNEALVLLLATMMYGEMLR